MHNIHLVGNNQPLDKFSIRSSLIVVGMFGVILIVSYFNELNRAGLLSRHGLTKRVPYATHLSKREYGSDNLILQKDGNVHHLDLDLKPLHALIRGGNSSKSDKPDHADKEEINIKLHIGKNTSYSVQNSSNSIRVYQHQNTVPNFLLSFNYVINGSSLTGNVSSVERLAKHWWAEKRRTLLHNSTAIFLYQHEPGGYSLRDCLQHIADQQKLRTSNVPLNAVYRNEWEKLPAHQKNKFQLLYGGLSFGACEGIDHPCSYSTFLIHPIDRILQVYAMCKDKVSKSVCHLSSLDMSNTTITDFIHSEGNNLFQKLLYYSRHCKLLGDDEVCIHDKQSFFLLTPEERSAYLANVLENLPKWFRTIGLVQHWQDSMELFDLTYGLSVSKCFRKVYPNMLPHVRGTSVNSFRKRKDAFSFLTSKLMIDGKPYATMREALLNDTDVTKLLHADLAIYGKFEKLFNNQLEVWRTIQKSVPQKMLRGKDPNFGSGSSIRDKTSPKENLPNDPGKASKLSQGRKGHHKKLQHGKVHIDSRAVLPDQNVKAFTKELKMERENRQQQRKKNLS